MRNRTHEDSRTRKKLLQIRLLALAEFLRRIYHQCREARTARRLVCREEYVRQKDIAMLSLATALHLGAKRLPRLLDRRNTTQRGDVAADTLTGQFRAATPNRRWAAALASRIRPLEVMVRIAAGLLSIRNSNCSSASRRAAASASTRCRFSASRRRLRITSYANRPVPASEVNTRISCGKALTSVNANGSKRSERRVQNNAASTICQRESTVPIRITGNRYKNPNEMLRSTRQSTRAMIAIKTPARARTTRVLPCR